MKLLAALVAGLVASAPALAAPDEEALGKAEGYPVCKQLYLGRQDQRCLVGNLSHFDQVAPARTVKAGQPRALKRAPAPLQLSYTFRGKPRDLELFLAEHRNTGLLILKGDTVVYERYQYERKPEHRFQSYSMAKSVVAVLVGMAIAEGKIGSVDDLAQQYAPELKGHPYGETKLRHLLTMSSGVRFSEEYNGVDDFMTFATRTLSRVGPGGVDAVLPFAERERPAGTKFKYASAETQVLSVVLRAATGTRLAEELSEKLWRPMGAEADATWLIDGGGHELGYMGINATLRDWGRLGMLLANQGALDGKQIVPASWVKAMTMAEGPHLVRGAATQFNGYGYQTWLVGNTENAFALFGVRGQSVFIDPQSKVVIVHTAVHEHYRDPARSEQFALFFAALQALKDL